MSMPKTFNKPLGPPPPGAKHHMQPANNAQVVLNPDNFNNLIASKGVRMIHARPIPCPNVRDLYAGDHNPACNDCFNGFIYYAHKEFIGAIMGNDNQRQFNMNGSWDVSNAQIIIPSKYKDGTDFDVQVMDQIVIPDFTVRYYQRVEHSQTGIDRLHFPAVSLDKIVDSKMEEYFAGVDATINDKGQVQWLGDRRPGYDVELDRGIIYSINYYAKASFTILSLPHQLRITQTLRPDGTVQQQRFPQLCVVRKNFIPNDPNDTIGPSDTAEPRNGQV